MNHDQEPEQQLDQTLHVTRTLFHQVAHTLRAALPSQPADSEAARDRRHRAAIACVASLSPVNADEANLAARYVAAHSLSMAYLCELQAETDPARIGKLNAQSASMMRQANGARSLLLRVQAERHKRVKDNAACDQDAWSEHIALRLMTETLPPEPAAPASEASPAPEATAVSAAAAATPAPEPPPPLELSPAQPAVAAFAHEPAPATPPPEPPAEPAPGTSPGASRPLAAPAPPVPPASPPAPDPAPDLLTEADRYAVLYPRRARLIRRCHGLPDDCDFGPPEPAVVHAIATGTSPTLRALDLTEAA